MCCGGVQFTMRSISEAAHIYGADFLTLKYYDLLAVALHKIHPRHFPQSSRTLGKLYVVKHNCVT